ncbi:MAG: ABC transporter permease [Jaaginema sp. PMC 1079.18]|nr:ABC transporter permease [Jaaginema sp. PMC 1080.18]MEC4852843.1 ABC transporter permease [Jaaginema sp. PMC 1079.18]MEC4868509.1 ABC transporter permease [Jaaginema sp. PMC 1078.18]
MKPVDLLRLTWQSLKSNPLRSGLTTFGVFMGVAAVNATLQVRAISTAIIEAQLARQEAPQVEVYLWSDDGRSLRSEDIEWTKRHISRLQAVSGSAFYDYGDATYEDETVEIFVEAVSFEYLLTSGREIVRGRFFNQADFENYRPVVIIDRLLAEQLKLGENPIEKRIFISGRPHLVIGLMNTKLPEQNAEPKGTILVSLALYEASSGFRNIDGLKLRPKRLEDLLQVQDEVTNLLKQRFPQANSWTNNNAEDILQQKETLTLASRGLLAVGVIALLVAGVGIANITIASVMERTPEIGLRRAIGATRASVMLQFILEAVLLSLLGGGSAAIAIDATTRVVAKQFELPYNFEITTVGLSLGAAICVGVGSSFFPALRASQLEPVQALRQRN